VAIGQLSISSKKTANGNSLLTSVDNEHNWLNLCLIERACCGGYLAAESFMNQLERINETIATYRKHGWRLERVLLRPETERELADSEREVFEMAAMQEATVDALWFTRPSHAGREAWELRLLTETPYALFETFEADETEEEREEVRREMEARLAEFAARS
jgi:hypothetical protein